MREVEEFRVANESGYIKDGAKNALKYRQMKIKGFGLKPISWTDKGSP